MSIDVREAKRILQARYQKQLEERETARNEALQAVRTVVPEVVTKFPAVSAAYLFGSILRPGAFRADSDIDIAIEGGSARDYFAVWHTLEEALPHWLIDLRDLPPDTGFTRRVKERGEKIYG